MKGINHAIDSGVTSHGIGFDELDRDISNLLDMDISNAAELVAICNQLDRTGEEVAKLHKMIERFMPHKMPGNLMGVVGKNRLMSFLMDIQDSAVCFRGGIKVVSTRTKKILAGKEQMGLFEDGI